MSNRTPKPMSDQDGDQVLKYAFNDVDATISTNGFLVGEVGRQITLATSTTTNPGDTQTYTFADPIGVQLYQIQLIYTDNTYATLISATRIA